MVAAWMRRDALTRVAEFLRMAKADGESVPAADIKAARMSRSVVFALLLTLVSGCGVTQRTYSAAEVRAAFAKRGYRLSDAKTWGGGYIEFATIPRVYNLYWIRSGRMVKTINGFRIETPLLFRILIFASPEQATQAFDRPSVRAYVQMWPHIPVVRHGNLVLTSDRGDLAPSADLRTWSAILATVGR
jgi:hypothetical protein